MVGYNSILSLYSRLSIAFNYFRYSLLLRLLPKVSLSGFTTHLPIELPSTNARTLS